MLNESFMLDDYTIIGQGVTNGSQSKLIKLFNQAVGPTIFIGTVSFFHSVNFISNEIDAVVLPKLPFVSPEEPLTAATIEAMDQTNMDPFQYYTLPEAVLTFKQMFNLLLSNNSKKRCID
ncbi:helicase C-terminal domain-containing protein [Bacillus carboniphilus]|uniref:Helicase C-terminal domain-containing protein n=1 Tax=Bacillus carboniphilus TaxID=86663 RepID=A0ABY9K1C7_9BACI|nr:helicase C-terminal domain-containing protein [Bacillus carboniphilus]WLR43711.1 helicase C-terminal domain-containing protein [Bacillus carboniphilus]